MSDWFNNLTKREAVKQGYTLITYEYENSETDLLESAYTQLTRGGIAAAVVRDGKTRTLWRKF